MRFRLSLDTSLDARPSWSRGGRGRGIVLGTSLATILGLVGLVNLTPAAAQRVAATDAAMVDLSFQDDLHFSVRVLTQGADAVPAATALVDAARSEPRLLAQAGSAADNPTPSQSTPPDNAAAATDPAPDQETIALNFQGADINALISLVSQVTAKSFIVDPRVKGKVTLVAGGGLPADKLYDIFLSVLEVSNFAAVPSGPVIKILPRNLVKQHPTPTTGNALPPATDHHITHIVTLEHAAVAEILPILRPMLPPTAHIAPHTGSNTMILTGTAANISRAVNLIERMDKQQRGVAIKVVYLEHADANKLSPIVAQTANALHAENTKSGQPQVNVSVQVDEGLNALIIQASEQEFPMLQALIDQLDIERIDSGDVHVVHLNFAQATDMVNVLTNLQQPREQDQSGAAPTTAVSVQADEQNNALIIRADNEDFANLLSVIKKLDVRRSQVFVETIIAEVSVNKESEIGVDWISNYRSRAGEDLSVNSGFSETAGGLKFGYINRYFRNLSGNIVPNLNVVLNALRSDRNTNIISTPNLLTLNNESAEIVVGQEVPFVTGNFTTNTTNTTATDDDTVTGVNPFQTIERKDVGLTLKITPQINDGDAIRLEIEQEVSSVSPTTVQGASDLITDTRSINATVQVDDQQVIVLGGLIRDDAVDIHQRIPLLSKIPLLGNLFRKKRKTAVKTNLMVFLRPKIIRTPEDLARLTEDRYEFIRDHELKRLLDGPQEPAAAPPAAELPTRGPVDETTRR